MPGPHAVAETQMLTRRSNMKRLVSLLVGAVCLGLCGDIAAAFTLKQPPKIAMVIYTRKNDGGWSQALDEARQRLEKELGVKIAVVENVADTTAAVKPAVDLLVSHGYNIILGSVFGYSEGFKQLSEQYPEVAFLTRRAPQTAPIWNLTIAGHTRANISAAWRLVPLRKLANSALWRPTPLVSSTGP